MVYRKMYAIEMFTKEKKTFTQWMNLLNKEGIDTSEPFFIHRPYNQALEVVVQETKAEDLK